MKITTFFKGLFISSLIAGGITSAVVFSNINVISTPFPKVLTKQKYLQLCKEQNKAPTDKNKPLVVDYAALPSSDLSLQDIVNQKHLSTNAFILTTGSQAYSTTNEILVGQPYKWGMFKPFSVDNSAIMLKLYDLFYNDQSEHHVAVKDFNMQFFSLIDIVNTKEIIESQNLLQYRRAEFPGSELPKPDVNNNGVSVGKSKVWIVDQPDSNVDIEQPVVKMPNDGAIEFNYEPTNSYYEFKSDNKFETPYEKVYFRDQNRVNLFNNTLEWLNNYARAYLPDFSVSKEGSIVCAKYDDKNSNWVFKTFSFGGIKLDEIISFYNSEYKTDQDQNNQGGSSGNSGNNQTTPPPAQSYSSSTKFFIDSINNDPNKYIDINKKLK